MNNSFDFQTAEPVTIDDRSLPDLTKFEAEAIIERCKSDHRIASEHKAYARRALYELERRNGHKALGYDNVPELAFVFLGIGRRYAFCLIRATRMEYRLQEYIPKLLSLNLTEKTLSILADICDRHSIQDSVEIWNKACQSLKVPRRIPTRSDIEAIAIAEGKLMSKQANSAPKCTPNPGVSNTIRDTPDENDDFEFARSLRVLKFDGECVEGFIPVGSGSQPTAAKIPIAEFRNMSGLKEFLESL